MHDPKSAGAVADTLIRRATENDPHLTTTAQALADKHGGHLEGLDFRIKTADSIEPKLRDDMAEKGLTADEAAAQLFDINRYTTVFDAADYAAGAQHTLDDLRANGYTTSVKNFWTKKNNPYQGINVQVTSPTGVQFEMQFHTADSLRVKEGELHRLYKLAKGETNPSKIADYERQMFAAAASIPVPPVVTSVS